MRASDSILDMSSIFRLNTGGSSMLMISIVMTKVIDVSTSTLNEGLESLDKQFRFIRRSQILKGL